MDDKIVVIDEAPTIIWSRDRYIREIERLRAENAALRIEKDNLCDFNADHFDEITELKKEIASWKARWEKLKKILNKLENWSLSEQGKPESEWGSIDDFAYRKAIEDIRKELESSIPADAGNGGDARKAKILQELRFERAKEIASGKRKPEAKKVTA